MATCIFISNREVKRVSRDFRWPLNQTWEGYLNPYYQKCPKCNNGYTAAREFLEFLIHRLLVAGHDCYRGNWHPYTIPLAQESAFPSIDLSELTDGLAGRNAIEWLGYDSIDNWVAVKKVISAAGLDPEKWGICEHCNGDAIDSRVKKEYESWKPTEPPAGDGWQMWETCSEGSPISPVFDTPEGLAEYCADNCTTFGAQKSDYQRWLDFIMGNGHLDHVLVKPK